MSKEISIQFLSSSSKKNESGEIPTISEKNGSDEMKPFYNFINQLLDAENLIVLAGSGTSLTFNKDPHTNIAPSMWYLWEQCSQLENFEDVKTLLNYSSLAEKNNDQTDKEDIELLLSLCDSYLALNFLEQDNNTKVKNFLQSAQNKILKLTRFVSNVPEGDWHTHNLFISVLGKRSPKQKRLKIFTTNYDLAFETAASNTGMIVIDGFEYSAPSRFNPAWFHYDIVNRSQSSDKGGAYLPNIVHLYKLHGSVDWVRTNKGVLKKTATSTDDESVFIYPSSNKYQSSYDSPYLDMMSAFLEALQKPKTAILCLGFGFNDKHINNAITMALRTNPELMLMIATKDPFNESGSFNAEIRDRFTRAIQAGDSRIAIANCMFDDFVSLLPNRHEKTPEEKVFEMFEKIMQGGSKQ